MKIRKAKKSDLKEIDDIYLEGVLDENKFQSIKKSRADLIKEMNSSKKQRLKDWKNELKYKNMLWLVAEENKKIVGFAHAEIKLKNQGWLTMLYIDKNFRRKGIGKKLTKERIKWLKKRNVKEICSGILIKNKKSINNLKKQGFVINYVKMIKKLK